MLLEIMRVLALEAEPLIGNFVIEHILTRATGEQLETQVIKIILSSIMEFSKKILIGV